MINWFIQQALLSPHYLPVSYKRASLVAQLVKNLPASRRPRFYSWVRKIPWRKAWQPSPVFLPGESHGQRNQAGYSPWGHRVEHNNDQAQHTYQSNHYDPSASLPTSRTWFIIMDWPSLIALVAKNLHASAGDVRHMDLIPGSGRSPGGGNGNHSSPLAWKIPWTEEPGGL